MAKVITAIFYDVTNSKVVIEHYIVKAENELLDVIRGNPSYSKADVLYYNDKYQLAFVVNGAEV